MKKLFLIFAVVAVATISCKKDEEPDPTPAPTPYQITSSDIAGIGELYKVAVYTVTPADTFTVGATGQSRTWIYNPIPLTYVVDSSEFHAVSEHPDGAFFTGANMYMETDGAYMFLNKQSDKVEVVGIWVEVNGDTLKGLLSDKFTIMKFPILFGSAHNDTGYVSIMSTMDYMGTTVPAKYEMTFKVDATCNASGNITTPIGTFKCLREKRTEINKFKVSVQVYSQWMEAFSQNDTSYTYTFWSKDKKWNVAEVDVDATDKVLSIGYLTEDTK